MLPAGTIVGGKFRIEEQIGSGASSVVYEARHVFTDLCVALKVMNDGLQHTDVAERFIDEARTPAKIPHPGIVRIYDASQAGDTLWLAMERLYGQSLADRLSDGPLDGQEVATIFGQLVDVVGHVHRAGFIHRDLKPANVFLEGPGGAPVVRLLDFGVAKPTGARAKRPLTAPGDLLGTPLYMAPEQLLDSRGVDPRADVYALGAMLYECLTGRLPRPATSIEHLIVLMHTAPVPPLGLPPGSQAEAYGALALRCLLTDPAARPESCEALAQTLHQLAQAPEVEARPSFLPASGRGVWLRWVGLSALLLLCGGFGLRTLLVSVAAESRAPRPPQPVHVLPVDVRHDAPAPALIDVVVKSSSDRGLLSVDGEPYGPAAYGHWDLALAPGTHTFELDDDGALLARTTKAIGSGEPAHVFLSPLADGPAAPAPQPSARPRPPAAAWHAPRAPRKPAPNEAMPPTQTLGPDQLNPVVQREGAQLQRCWESALKHGKAPAGPAVLTVQLTVGRDGTVDNVLFDAADFGGLHPCLERTLRRLRFPRSAGTTEFAVPLELDPGG